MPFRSLAADDIFISYTRLDASTYANGLADELTKKGFSCFIDKLGTEPNKDLPDTLLRKLKSCAMLVIVGTERAATRQTITDEVKNFLDTGRKYSIVPIDFGGAIYRANWYSLIEGVAPEPEKNPSRSTMVSHRLLSLVASRSSSTIRAATSDCAAPRSAWRSCLLYFFSQESGLVFMPGSNRPGERSERSGRQSAK